MFSELCSSILRCEITSNGTSKGDTENMSTPFSNLAEFSGISAEWVAGSAEWVAGSAVKLGIFPIFGAAQAPAPKIEKNALKNSAEFWRNFGAKINVIAMFLRSYVFGLAVSC